MPGWPLSPPAGWAAIIINSGPRLLPSSRAGGVGQGAALVGSSPLPGSPSTNCGLGGLRCLGQGPLLPPRPQSPLDSLSYHHPGTSWCTVRDAPRPGLEPLCASVSPRSICSSICSLHGTHFLCLHPSPSCGPHAGQKLWAPLSLPPHPGMFEWAPASHRAWVLISSALPGCTTLGESPVTPELSSEMGTALPAE